MRAFIAIELPPDIKETISLIQEDLKPNLPKLAWVKPLNLHLTLKFLGEISEKQSEKIKTILYEITKDSGSFKISLKKIGAFPGIKWARVVWVGSDDLPDGLAKIAESLETGLSKLGFAKEKRSFRLHITIARIKTPVKPTLLEENILKAQKIISDKGLEFETKGITLFQSILGRNGPTYEILSEEKFKTN